MAATALEVLSLDYAKQQLRIEEPDHEHDDLISGLIGAAVSFVGRFLRAPLVDTTETHRCNRPGDEQPLVLRADHVQSMAAIRYWSEDRELRQPSDGSIAVADLGRRVEQGPYFCVWPPADGWPEIATDSLFEIDIVRSLRLTARTMALRDACVLAMRALYDGGELIKPTAAMYALMFPWRRLDADPPGTLVSVLDGAPSGDIPETTVDPTDTPLGPSTPIVTPHTNYLLASLDDTFSAAEVVASGSNSALRIPPGTVHSGGALYFAYARLASEGPYRYVYLYPQGHRDPQSQIAGWIDDGTTLEIAGASQRLLRTRVAYHENANGSVVEAA